MKNLSKSTNYLKIGQAAKALGVSIDTLRRWEKAGKIQTQRTPGGTRLYSRSSLKKINPQVVSDFEAKSLTTEELLKRAAEETDNVILSDSEGSLDFESLDSSVTSLPQNDNLKQSFVNKFLIGTGILSAVTLAITGWIAASYLTQPKATQEFFKNNVASGLLSPFHKLAEETVAVISPQKAQELGFIPQYIEPPPINDKRFTINDNPNVLAVTTSSQFLEINTDTQINGALFVRDQINNLSLEGTPSASTITLSSGETVLTVSNDATLDQDVSTTSTPAFNFLNLSATSNQLVFQSGGPSGTLTWTPTAARVITLPDATTTLMGKDTTDTLTNKSISGSSNTLTNIPNSALVNSKVTVTAGTNLSGGGDVTLGSSVTLSLKTSPAVSGVLNLADGTAAAPSLTFTDDADTGLYRIGSNRIGLITGGSATSGITIDGSGNLGIGNITPSATLYVSGNAGIGYTGSSVAVPGLGLAVAGSVGIGTTSPGANLDVIGTGRFSSTLSLSDGTAATPALNFINDTDTGLWRIGANQLALTTGGGAVSGLNINSSGNVGIGTTNQSASLHIQGTTDRANLRLTSDSTGDVLGFIEAYGPGDFLSIRELGGKGLYLQNQDSAGPTIINPSGGNIGIGTVSPTDKLIVTGGNVGIGISSPLSTLAVNGNSTIGWGLTGVAGPSNGLAVSGNVGVGTTSPAGQLDVSNSFYTDTGRILVRATDANDEGGQLDLAPSSPTYTNTISVDSYQGRLRFFSNSPAKVISLSFGTTPELALEGDGPALSGKISGFGVIEGAGSTDLTLQTVTSGNILLKPVGNVGIGTSAAGAALQVNGGGLFGWGTASVAGPSNGLAVSGSIGIGTTSTVASTPLTIRGTANGLDDELIAFQDNGGTTKFHWNLYRTGGLNLAETGVADGRLFIAIGGNVGIGDSGSMSPPAQLFVSQTSAGDAFRVEDANADTSPFVINQDGNVGIANSAPSYALDVIGTTRISGATTLSANNAALSFTGTTPSLTSGSSVFGIFAGGNVGIGTTGPLPAALTIRAVANGDDELIAFQNPGGTTKFHWNLYRTGGGLNLAETGVADGRLFIAIGGNVGIGDSGSMSPPAQLFVSQTSAGDAFRVEDANADTSPFVINDAGNVGISNSAPSYTLDVVGTGRISSLLNVLGNVGIGTSGVAGAALQVNGGGLFGWGTAAVAGPSNGLGVLGNVGIGTTSPSSALQVVGNISASGTISAATGGTTNAFLATSGGTNLFIAQGTFTDRIPFNFGVGGTATVTGTDGTSQLALSVSAVMQPSSSTTNAAEIDTYPNFQPGSGVTISKAMGVFIESGLQAGSGSITSGYGLYVDKPTFGTNKYAAFFGGNVGIGTTGPGATLAVFGNSTIGFGNSATSPAGPSSGLAVSGNVGIGTTTANSALTVAGGVAIGTGFNVTAPTNGLLVQGNVGIGFTTPDRLTQIAGDVNPAGTNASLISTAGTTQLSLTGGSATGLQKKLVLGIDTTDNYGVIQAGNTSGTNYDLSLNPAGGNVGIGTTSPLGQLDVSNSFYTSSGTISLRPRNSTDTGGRITFDTPSSTYNTSAIDFYQGEIRIFQDSGPRAFGFNMNASSPTFRLQASGPSLKGTIEGFSTINAADSTDLNLNTVTSGNILLSPAGGGNVGIGVSSPGARLQVNSNGVFWASTTAISAPTNGLAVQGNVGIGTTTANSNLSVAGNAHIGSLYQGIAAPANGLFVDGNVGIGATTSSNKLDVWGNSRLAGTLTVDSTSTFGGNFTLSSGQFLAPDGTASAPAYSFSADTDTGIYRPSTNALAFNTAGASTPPLTITAGGNVGIGTTAPVELLEVSGGKIQITRTGNANLLELSVNSGGEVFYFNNTGDNLNFGDDTHDLITFDSANNHIELVPTAGNVGIGWTSPTALLHVRQTAAADAFRVDDVANDSTPFIIDQAGNVGVGATTAAYNLDVWGTGRITGNLTLTGITTSSGVFLAPDGTAAAPAYSFSGDTDIGLWRIGANQLALTTGGAAMNGLAINSNGNVGIGTTDPGARLIVTSGNVGIGTSAAGAALQVNGGGIFWPTTSSLTGPSNGLAVFGNVGIGTTTANSNLSVAGNAHIGSIRQGISAPTDGLFVDGNVGIGATTSSNKLDVWGNSRITGTLTVDGALTSGSTTMPSLTLTGANAALSFTGTTPSLTSGSSVFGLFAGGNVGIGTTGNVYGGLTVRGAGTGTNITLQTYGSGLGQGLTVLDNGNVGIGTTGPTSLLHLSSTAAQDLFRVDDDGAGDTSPFVIASDGNVGIANSAPSYTLDVIGTTRISSTAVFNGAFTLGDNGETGEINTSDWDISTTGAMTGIGAITADGVLTLSANNAALSFTGTTPSLTSGSSVFGLFAGGNVGIGTTGNVYGGLTVRGAGTGTGITLQTYGSGLGQGLTVLDNGNVGVGTTSPLGALHVVGQCVAWDTRIRVRRRKRSRNKFGMTDDILEWDYLEVMIKDILPGDEVLSLNELTKEFEYQRVEKLLDMGLKGVYELTTLSGKKIKTTGNHPYLTHLRGEKMQLHLGGVIIHQSPIQGAGWVKVINLKVGDQIAVAKSDLAVADLAFGGFSLSSKNNISQSKGNNNQSIGNSSQQVNFSEIHDNFLLNMYPNNNDSIPQKISAVNTVNLDEESIPGNMGLTIANPTQNTEKLINQSASTESKTESIFNITNQSTINHQTYQWDTITSIKYLGYEHVYDLQIENTHNFVGNDIVAHNTYLNGSTGLGAAFVNTTTPANGLAVAGNVGIGTTTANSNLSVAGSAHIGSLYQGISAPANGLFVDGNVGIGATTSSNKLDVWGNSRLAGTLTVDSTSTFGGNFTLSSGQFLAPNGSATAPSYSFTNSTGTGMYSPSSNALALNTNGASTPPLTITAGGNVGIGNTNPSAILELTGNLLFTKEAARTISVATSTSTNTAGGALTVQSGTGVGTGVGGALNLTAGNGGSGGANGGAIVLTSGSNGGTGSTGAINLTVSSGSGGSEVQGGAIALTAGDSTGSNRTGGTISLTTGYGGSNTGTGGAFSVTTGRGGGDNGGAAGNGGAITLTTGNAGDGSGSNTPISGAISLITGTGQGVDPANTGNIILRTGAAVSTGTAGTILFQTNGATTRMAVNGGGNVGVGTSVPGALFVVTGGNVGIGTSAAGAALQVNGGGLFGWGTTSTALSSGAIAGFNGNVGVGTTSPLGALHVVGQCVTGDTKLRRRRRKNTSDGEHEVDSSEVGEIWEEVRIDQIQAGDEILTLDEHSGEFVVSKVNALMDMGIQEVYEMETITGKRIKTTGNHPYLTFKEWLLIKGNIDQNEGDNNQRKSNTSLDIDINNVFVFHKTNYITNLLSVNALTNASIPNNTFMTKGINFNLGFLANIGIIIAAPNQPADRLINKSEKASKKTESILSILPFEPEAGKWTKVSQLKVGQFIATIGDDGNSRYEKIISIKKLGREQTFDIEVEGTHNFIGNDIVAHNTYINGSTGLGAAFVNTTTPANGLAVSGNVGIGTTTANSNLSVAGNAHIGSIRQGISAPTDGLFVDGNVGIGATTSSNKLDVWGNSRLAGTLTVDSTSTFGGNFTLSSGQFLAPNGTASLPSYSFTNSTSTGMYSPSANALALNTNGASTPPLTITAGGNVGIGTTAPVELLEVSGGKIQITRTGNANLLEFSVNSGGEVFYFNNTGDNLNFGDDTHDLITFDSANNHIELVPTAGNVGIGWTSPTALLHVRQTGAADAFRVDDVANDTSPFIINQDGNVGIANSAPSYALDVIGTLRTSGQTILAASSGNVGIGTAAPAAILNTYTTATSGYAGLFEQTSTSNSSVTVRAINAYTATSVPAFGLFYGYRKTNTAGEGAGIHFALQDSGSTEQEYGGLAAIIRTNTAGSEAGDLALYTTDAGTIRSEKVRITSSGNVGIGFTSPSALLHVRQTGAADSFRVDDIANDSSPFVIDQNGNTGIGTAAPGNILDIQKNQNAGTGIFVANTTSGTGSYATTRLGTDSSQFLHNFILSTGYTTSGIFQGTRAFVDADTAGGLWLGSRNASGTVSIFTGGSLESNERIRVTSGGNVGIGTTTVNSTLAVVGSAHIGGLYQGISAPANGLFVDGNVGIGATTSSNKLDVWGNSRITGTLTVDGALTSGSTTMPSLTLTGNNAALSFTGTTPSLTSGSSVFGLFAGGNVGIGTTGNVYGGLTVRGAGTGTNITLQTYGSGLGQGLTVLDNGNVGIGTTAPGKSLHVAGDARIGGTAAGDYVDITSTSKTLTFLQSNAGSGGHAFLFQVPGWSGDYFAFGDGSTERMRIDQGTGNVGIGTSSPLSLLSVAGNAHIGSIRQGISAPTDGLFVDGNVGIGATTSSNKLDVWGNSRLAGTLTVDSNSTIGGTLGVTGVTTLSANNAALSFTGSTPSLTSGSSVFGLFAGGNVGIGTTGNVYGGLTVRGAGTGTNITLQTYGSGLGQGLTVLDNGNVGIGNTSPSQTFQVNPSGSSAFVVNSSGNVGIGFTSPTAKLEILSTTTPQLRVAYDTSNYMTTAVSSTGAVTLDTNGTGSLFSMTDPLTISPTATTLTTSLESYWKMDENSGTRADSVGSNTLNDNATVTSNPGKIGNAGDFERDNSEYLSIDDNASLSTGNIDFTVAAWVNFETDAIAQGIFCKSNISSSGEYCLWLWNGGDQLSFNVINSTGTAFRASSGPNVATGTWYFVVGWYDAAAGTVNIQVDNDTVASTAVTGTIADTAVNVVVGASGTTIIANFMDGRIDGVGFWKKVLTAAERTELYNGGTGLDHPFKTGLNLNGDLARTIQMQRHTTSNTAGNSLTLLSGGATAAATDKNGGNLILQSGVSTGTGTSQIQFWTVPAGSTSTTDNLATQKMVIDGAGNVGIGFTSPTAALHVRQTSAANAFLVEDVADDTSSPFVINLDGNVGIANSAPSYALDVIGSTRFSTNITQGAGQFLAADGSASAPAYSFSADTDNGMFRPSTDALGFATGGSSRMTITAAGNVGIGITAPSGVFQVGSSATAPVLFASSLTGNVGIGLISPGQKLEVTGSIKASSRIFAGVGSVASPGYAFQDEGASDSGIWSAGDDILAFASGGVEVARFTGRYNNTSAAFQVGTVAAKELSTAGGTLAAKIAGSYVTLANGTFSGDVYWASINPSDMYSAGTTTIANTATLYIASAMSPRPEVSITNNYALWVDAGQSRFDGNVGIGTTNAIQRLQINESTSNPFVVTSGGNVGIGYTTPTANLHVLNTAAQDSFRVDDVANDSSPFIIDQGGNVGIGVASAPTTLYVNGNAMVGYSSGAPASLSNGLAVSGNVGIGTTSPNNKLEILSTTTPQLRVAYNTSNYATWAVSSVGASTISSVGSTNALTLSTNATSSGTGGAITIQTASSDGTSNSDGGDLIIETGQGANNGSGSKAGDLTIRTSRSAYSGGRGGAISITASDGNSALAGGAVSITSGSGDGGTAGTLTLTAGSNTAGNAAGAVVDINGGAGFGSGAGGAITLDAGAPGATGTGGGITLTTGAGGSTSGNSGNLTLATGTVTSGTAGSLIFKTGGTEYMRITSGGNVGIGFTSPTATLHIRQTAAANAFLVEDQADDTSSPFIIDQTGNVGIGTSVTGNNLAIVSGASSSVINAGSASFTTSSSRTIKENFNLISGDGILDKIGNVPVYTFDFIDGPKNIMGLVAEDFYTIFGRGDDKSINYQEVAMASWLGIQELNNRTQSLQSQLYVSGSGNVGIGTTNPLVKLDVAGNARISGNLDLGAATIASSSGNLAIQFSSDTVAGVPTQFIIKNSLGQGLFSIDASGSARLAGTLTTEAGAFDVAEDYEVADNTIEAGDVVSIADHPELVEGSPIIEKSTQTYQNNLLGIISTKAALRLSNKNTSGETRPVALNGRVPVKVSTENGPIEKGDYLTSSSTPGVAMKAIRPGPVVGKALEQFTGDSGQGTENTNTVTCNLQPETCPQGKILAFVNISYADPGNFLANLSMDDQGNLIIPKIRAGSIILDSSVASASASLTAGDGQLSLSTDPTYTSAGPNLASNSNQYIDLAGEIASIEDRLAELKARSDTQTAQIKNLQDILGNVGIGTTAMSSSEATPSAEATPSSTLNLTPPDILLNTGSAVFTNLTVKSEATMSGQLTAYDLNVSASLKSLGTTALGTTIIAGDLTVDGTLTIENGSELNVIGTLFLQKSYLAEGLDIFNGKVTIDKDGVLKAQTLLADQIKINEGKTVGSGKILAGLIEVVIENPYVEDTSLILVTPNAPLLQTLGVVERKAKTETASAYFKVKLAQPETQDINFDYLIIGVNRQTPVPISQTSSGGT